MSSLWALAAMNLMLDSDLGDGPQQQSLGFDRRYKRRLYFS